MIETIHKKGRDRKYIGVLENFFDLSDESQKIFFRIKNEIKSQMGDGVNVYVFGSYAWGYSDDKSDFDVRVDKPLPRDVNLSKVISDKLGKQVHIQNMLKNIRRETPLIV